MGFSSENPSPKPVDMSETQFPLVSVKLPPFTQSSSTWNNGSAVGSFTQPRPSIFAEVRGNKTGAEAAPFLIVSP